MAVAELMPGVGATGAGVGVGALASSGSPAAAAAVPLAMSSAEHHHLHRSESKTPAGIVDKPFPRPLPTMPATAASKQPKQTSKQLQHQPTIKLRLNRPRTVRLTSDEEDAHGEAEDEESDEETLPFGGVITGADADTSRSTITADDKTRFERSRLRAEVGCLNFPCAACLNR